MRALKYDPDFLAANREKLKENTVFVKTLPKDIGSKDLHEKLEDKFGKIKSLKISIDKDYKSNGYGFVTFWASENAEKVLNDGLDPVGLDHS